MIVLVQQVTDSFDLLEINLEIINQQRAFLLADVISGLLSMNAVVVQIDESPESSKLDQAVGLEFTQLRS